MEIDESSMKKSKTAITNKSMETTGVLAPWIHYEELVRLGRYDGRTKRNLPKSIKTYIKPRYVYF